MASLYSRAIKNVLDAAGIKDVEPAHVEVWMRSEHGVLDGLSPARFKRAALMGARMARAQPKGPRC